MGVREKTGKKQLGILRLLQRADGPLSGSRLLDNLQAMGYEVSERTVRHYLQEMEGLGLVKDCGKNGRMITELGKNELSCAGVFDKVGFLAAKIDQLTYQMTFDLQRKSGTVIVNVSLIDRVLLAGAVAQIVRVFEAGYALGTMLTVFRPGERTGMTVIPDNMVGIGTVCSITFNGVLLSQGIPSHSVFGGLLELRDREPARFVEIIKYDGTSLDPLEVFIRSGMTDCAGAARTGNGRIGVGFREVPSDSRAQVIALSRQLEEVGLGGFLMIGWPGQPLLEIPVTEGRAGAIVVGGLNPSAILEEVGIKVQSRALAGLVEFDALFHYRELPERIRDIF